MASQTINIFLEPTNTFNITVGATNITLKLNSVATANFINADGKFFLDGAGGTTYFTFNSTTNLVELWVLGVRQGRWGDISGNPFA